MKWLAALCVVAACGAAPRYPLHPTFRSASGGQITIVGAVASPGPIPYAPGILLTCALRLAGGPTELGVDRAEITRVERDHARSFVVPIRAIVAGDAPDLELAPGDQIVVTSMVIVD